MARRSLQPEVYGVIYVITNTVNGKMYVGQTVVGIVERIAQHRCVTRYATDKSYLHRAMRKHGFDSFRVVVVDTASNRAELDAKEIEWIARLDTMNPAVGYNCLAGGEGGVHGPSSRSKGPKGPRSTETKAKISAANKGRKLSPEQIEKHRQKMLGRKWSPEVVTRRAESLKRTLAARTPEQREAYAEGVRRRAASPEFRTKLSAAIKAAVDRKSLGDRSRAFWNSLAGKEAKHRRRQQLLSRLCPEYCKKAWQTRRADPEKLSQYKAKAAAKMKQFWDKPETREHYRNVWSTEKRKQFGKRMSEQSNNFWASPRSESTRHLISARMKGNFKGERRAELYG